MSKEVHTYHFSNTKAFTLIELLVVISIIGVLASIVIASLASAKEKATIATIQRNLFSMINAVELAHNGSNYSGACTAVAPLIEEIENKGGYAACYTHGGNGVANARWAVSAHPLSDRTKNFSVDSSGVVEWDGVDKPNATWSNAIVGCRNDGKKLPTMEMVKSLDLAQFKHGSRNAPAYGFTADYYWSDTVYPLVTSQSFRVYLINGNVAPFEQYLSRRYRCVG